MVRKNRDAQSSWHGCEKRRGVAGKARKGKAFNKKTKMKAKCSAWGISKYSAQYSRLRAVSRLLLNPKKAARSTTAESGEAAIVSQQQTRDCSKTTQYRGRREKKAFSRNKRVFRTGFHTTARKRTSNGSRHLYLNDKLQSLTKFLNNALTIS